jgi:membrane-associated phospholipid phosphatase
MSIGRPKLALAAFLQSVAAFAFLAQAYTTDDAVAEVDAWLANTLHANLVPSATAAFTAVTTLGNTSVLAVVAGMAAAYLLLRRRARDVALLAVTLVGAQLLTWVLKEIFERPRPSFDDPVVTAGWFSFPSGHASSSIAVYGALAYVCVGGDRSLRARAFVAGVALLVAAIGFSRLYLGVHYLTDVVAGYSAGLAWLVLAIGIVQTRYRRSARATPLPSSPTGWRRTAPDDTTPAGHVPRRRDRLALRSCLAV